MNKFFSISYYLNSLKIGKYTGETSKNNNKFEKNSDLYISSRVCVCVS